MTEERLQIAAEVAAKTGGYFRAGKGPKDESLNHPVRRPTEEELQDWWAQWGLDDEKAAARERDTALPAERPRNHRNRLFRR